MNNGPQYLFNRKWLVAIGQQGQPGNAYDKLRVVFDIDKNLFSSPNKSKIGVYNLTLTQRRGISIANPATGQLGDIVRLDAGYQDLVETLYIGDIARAKSERKGADIITTFECGDSEKQLIYSHFEQSYPPGTTLVRIITDCAKALGVNIGTILGVPTKTYNSGVSFSGSVKGTLDKILAFQALEWSVQNGTLNIIPTTAHLGTEAVLISKETGMIGVPSQGEEFLQFTSLLNPKLVPGALVFLETQTVNGSFKIRRSHFEGDSHGQKWQVECEATPIFAAQSLPANRGLTFGSAVS